MNNYKSKIALVLSFVMMLFLFNVTGVSAEEKKFTVNFKYHYSSFNGWYNKDDNGKTNQIKFYLKFNGTNKETNQKEAFYTETYTVDTIIGDPISHEIDISGEMTGTSKETGEKATYINVEPEENNEFHLVIDENQHIYAANSGGQSADHMDKQVIQNMNVSLRTEIEEGAIVLDKHKDDMAIRYTVKGDKKGTIVYPKLNNDNKPIEAILPFVEEKVEVGLYDVYSFHKAIEQNSLMNFGISGDRMEVFELVAEFTGDNAEELNKLYTLTIDGNDIDGWTLKLGSNLKQKGHGYSELVPFETVYEDDPTMMVGEEKVKQEGVEGKKFIDVKEFYYVDMTNGEDIVVETITNVSKEIAPQNKIILRGTKKEVKKDELLNAGENTSLLSFAGVGLLTVGAAIIVFSKNKEENI